jgi:hypothetical protein
VKTLRERASAIVSEYLMCTSRTAGDWILMGSYSVEEFERAIEQFAQDVRREALAECEALAGGFAQGICERVNMGDATADEIAGELMTWDSFIKQLRSLAAAGEKGE